MADLLPIFPLGTVLFPGVPLSLHVFEERYRRLLRHLLDGPSPRRFGVVAIRQGDEVGDGDPVLHDVGCVAEIRQVVPYPDGRYDVVTTGGPRFRLLGTDDSLPYLMGTVTYIGEPPGDDLAGAAAAVRRAFPSYWDAVGRAGGGTGNRELPDPPLHDDPALLSWLVAAAMRLDLPEKQHLLGIVETGDRLRYEHTVLRRETALLRHAAARPVAASEGPFSLN